jgi:hypothetical protein
VGVTRKGQPSVRRYLVHTKAGWAIFTLTGEASITASTTKNPVVDVSREELKITDGPLSVTDKIIPHLAEIYARGNFRKTPQDYKSGDKYFPSASVRGKPVSIGRVEIEVKQTVGLLSTTTSLSASTTADVHPGHAKVEYEVSIKVEPLPRGPKVPLPKIPVTEVKWVVEVVTLTLFAMALNTGKLRSP